MTTYIASTDGESITGSTGNDVIIGKSGDDILNGGAGADILLGGAGSDIIYYDEFDIKVDGGTGYDTLIFGGTGQSLNLGLQKTVMNFEQINLAGGGGHTLTFSAADVLRTSDNDVLLIHGTQSSHVNFADSGWSFQGYGSGLSKFVNGTAIVYVDVPVFVTGFSNNATLTLTGGSATSVTEDLGPDGSNNLVATGNITVSDPNTGQALLTDQVQSLGATKGSLVLASGAIPGLSTGGYTYKISNAQVQDLAAGQDLTESFIVKSLDGSTKTLTFTTHGVNDPAQIGDPSIDTVKEDVQVDANGMLVAEGTISISDVDQDQQGFSLVGFNGQGNWGVLALSTDGSYTYTVDNASINSWNSARTETDSFLVTSIDGTTASVSFTVHGTNDKPTIVDGVFSAAVTEDPPSLNPDGTLPSQVYMARGNLTFTDPDHPLTGGFIAFVSSIDGAIGQRTANIIYPAPGTDDPAKAIWSINYKDTMFDSLNSSSSPLNQFYTITIRDPDGAQTTHDLTVTITGANDPIMGDDDINNIDGTAGNDVISGLGEADVLRGLGGNDFIHGGTGDDWIEGNDGNDILHGWTGDDQIDGGIGNNELYGEDGNDQLTGGSGNDLLDGGAGADEMYGGLGDDVYIVDNAGDTVHDLFKGGADRIDVSVNYALNADADFIELIQLTGSAGLEVSGNGFSNHITGSTGNDTLHGGDGFDVLLGGAGDDTLYGDGGNDELNGGGGNDEINGGLGDDKLVADAGNDTLNGDEGKDQLLASTGNVTAHGGTGNDFFGISGDVTGFMGGDAGIDTFQVRGLRSGSQGVTLEGGDGADTFDLIGQFANDLVFIKDFDGMKADGIFDKMDLDLNASNDNYTVNKIIPGASLSFFQNIFGASVTTDTYQVSQVSGSSAFSVCLVNIAVPAGDAVDLNYLISNGLVV